MRSKHSATQLAHYLVIGVASLALLACGSSDSIDNIDEPPLVSPVSHPLIMNDQLMEYDPLSKRTKRVIDITLSDRLVVFMDSDSLDGQSDALEREITANNRLPDFMAFTSRSMDRLYLLDLETRYLHLLYEFNSATNPNGREQICNLRNIPILDTGSVNSDAPILKEKQGVYVEAVSINSDCSDSANLQHYEIETLASTDENTGRYKIRTLRTSDEGETSIELSERQVLVGSKRTITETVMYGMPPISQPNQDAYGHLGFDRQNNNALSFFTRDIESLVDEPPLWVLEGDNFDLQAANNGTLPSTPQPFSTYFRAPQVIVFNDYAIMELGWKVVALPISAVFDDDSRNIRENALNNPLIERANQSDPYSPVTFVQSSNSGIYVLDRDRFYQIESPNSAASETLINTTNVANSDISVAGPDELIVKQFDDDSLSIVTYTGSNTETTIEPRTSEESFGLTYESNLHWSQFDELNETWKTVLYNNIGDVDPTSRQNTAYGVLVDEQSYFGHDTVSTSELVVYLSENQVNPNPTRNLTQPRVLPFDNNGIQKEDELAFLNENVRPSANNVMISLTDDYGLADLLISETSSDERQLLFYDPVNRVAAASLPEAMEVIPEPSAGSAGFSLITNCRSGNEIRSNSVRSCLP